MKEEIIKLRKEGKSYNVIAKELNCKKSLVSYHCRANGLGGVKTEKLEESERNSRNYQRVKNRRQATKEKAIEYKGGKCQKCGYNKCSWVFDFHHLDKNKKDFTLSSYLTLSWEKIKKELDKCIMVCANCHREIHYEEYLNK